MIGKIKVTVRKPGTVCTFGWGGTKRSPACNYTGGHFCDLDRDHKGPHRCGCGRRKTSKLVYDEKNDGWVKRGS